jgi:deazaflavin-dependent oxidoreductase (nitroreductase family)
MGRADPKKSKGGTMSDYKPSPRDWVAEQVELYESSGGTKGLTLRNTDLPVIIVTNRGWKTGAIRKTPLMRVVDGENYILVGSNGGAPNNPLWVNNLRADPNVTIQDETQIYTMRVREVVDPAERGGIWPIALEAFPRYQLYQENASQAVRVIPIFIAEPMEST